MKVCNSISIDSITQILMSTGSCILQTDDFMEIGCTADELVDELEERLNLWCGKYVEIDREDLSCDCIILKIDFD